MKKILLTLMFVCVMSVIGYAQQRPQYTLYPQNNFILNPAIAGIEDYYDAKLSYRSQWVGMEDAPKTGYFSLQGPIGNVDDKHHGIGGTIVSDVTGPSSRISFNVSYAFHFPINDKWKVSFGLSAGGTQYNLNTAELAPVDPNDPVINGGKMHDFLPEVGAGFWLHSDKFFLGMSGQQLIPATLDFGVDGSSTAENNTYQAHYFVTTGARFRLGENFRVTPSVMMKVTKDAPISMDLNLKVLYQESIWFGASIRQDDSFSLMAGVNINTLMNISYAYDYGISDLSDFNGGSHEVILGFTLNNKSGVKCPKNIW